LVIKLVSIRKYHLPLLASCVPHLQGYLAVVNC